MATEIVETRLDLVETGGSGVSWRSIVGGAVVMAAVAFILLALGAGFGFASISPWPGTGTSATRFAIVGAIWLIVVQWVSAGIGGYLAGRLRTGSTALHTDEVYFRDTAHGVIAWAFAAVLTAAFLASAASSVVGGTARGAANVAAAAAQGVGEAAAQNGDRSAPSGYLVDTLFRKGAPDTSAGNQDARGEATRILATGLRNGDVPQGDKTYLAQLVAARTGLSQDEAQKRVDGVIAQAKQAEQKLKEAADATRKAARNIAFFTAFSMLIGAFIAGIAAKIGGHHRDDLV